MTFSEELKRGVKARCDFTCCWCLERARKIDVHHIIPESEGGLDLIENAAPLCGSCHDLLGGNSALRKEILLRRDNWYAICARRWEVDPAVANPSHGAIVLAHHHDSPPRVFCPVRSGIHISDTGVDSDEPCQSSLTVYFKEFRSQPDAIHSRQGKWLHVQAKLAGFLNVAVEVRARSDRDAECFIAALKGGTQPASLHGELWPSFEESLADYLLAWPIPGFTKVSIAVSSPARSGLSGFLFLTRQVSDALASYLEREGFAEPLADYDLPDSA